jgi:hypothetical protein
MIKVTIRRTKAAVCTHEMQKDWRTRRTRTKNEEIESEEAKGQDPELP